MTKHEKWTEWPTQAYAAAYESLASTLDGFQNKFEVPETAREFVKRSAATAKDRSSDLHTGANKVTDAVEKAFVSAVNGLAEVNRKTVEALYQDTQSVFAAIDKLADAQSLSQAYRVYLDYLRQQTKVNLARVEATASFASTKASEGFGAFRDGIEKVLPLRSKAA
jgi:hypothetical protein